MDLKEIKSKITIESAEPVSNRKFEDWIKDPDDCFGRGYREDNKYCKECTVLSKLDNRYESLCVFCKELTPTEQTEDVGQESKGGFDRSKLLKVRKF